MHYQTNAIRTIKAAFDHIDPRTEHVAMTLGCSRSQAFWRITLPLVRPTVVAAAMLRFMDSVKTFDQIYVTTQGGPGIASQTLNLFVFDQAFQYMHFGYASALLVVLFFVILAGNLILVTVRRGQV